MTKTAKIQSKETRERSALQQVSQRMRSDRGYATDVLKDAGILDKNGRLATYYRDGATAGRSGEGRSPKQPVTKAREK